MTEKLCARNNWEWGGEDYDIAVSDVKWFLSQPEICRLFPKTEDNPDGDTWTYSLNCEQCGGVFQSVNAFPSPQLCPKCSEPKPDESRLLVSLHNLILTICEDKYAVPEMMAERITKEVDDYIAKTASIKDTECQARVKKIFKEIEKRQLSEKLERDAVPGMIIISNVQWEALKKEEEGL